MKKEILAIVLGFFISLNSYAQVTSIVENFDSTVGSFLPTGWAGQFAFGTDNNVPDHTTGSKRYLYVGNGKACTKLLAAGTYSVSFWMLLSNDAPENLRIGYCTNQQNILGTYTHLITASNATIYSWTYYQNTITLPVNAYFTWSGSGTSLTKQHYIDDVSIQLVTSNAENSAQPTFATYPNPSNGRFTVLQPEGNKFDFTVENLMGAVIYKAINQDQTFEIDITNQPKGLYILKSIDKNNVLAIKKLVIK